MRRVAVVGSGISGLSVAHGLAGHAQVTLFEAGEYFGGHTNTVDVTLDGTTHGVDTGFLVLNERTYPKLLALFAQLGVEVAQSDMSFSVQVPGHGRARGLEWSGCDLNTVFAQRSNLVRPGFWRMLRDLLRFNKLTTELAQAGDDSKLDQPIGDFLGRHGFSAEFRDWYFLPMIGCIWSCPTDQMLRFPIATMIRFCHNHGLLQVADRPQWYTVRGGARTYVERMLKFIPDARLRTPVRGIRRSPGGGVFVRTDAGTDHFDDVVLACHSDQSLALLADPSAEEAAVLGAIHYHRNRAVLHTDTSVLPKRRLAWAAWNYERAGEGSREQASVCLHYLLNRLQPLPFTTPVIVSLNPLTEPRKETVHGEFDYAHPVFDAAATTAQQKLPALQGLRSTWYCGAWTRYGFHEDGLMSGLAACEAIKARAATATAGRELASA
ncbi:FAD-dependent oxidoreductase [soil metagenome]